MLVKFVFEVPDDFRKGSKLCGLAHYTVICPLNSEICNKYNCPLKIVNNTRDGSIALIAHPKKDMNEYSVNQLKIDGEIYDFPLGFGMTEEELSSEHSIEIAFMKFFTKLSGYIQKT